MRMIREIIEFIKEDRFYRYLVLGLVLLYGAAFLGRQLNSGKVLQKTAVKKAQIEKLETATTPEALQDEFQKRPDLRKTVQLFMFFFLVVMGWGISLGVLAFQRRLIQKKNVIPENRHGAEIKWGIVEVVKVFILFFCFGVGITLAMKLFFFKTVDESYRLLLVHTFLVDCLVVYFICRFLKKTGSKISDIFGTHIRQNFLKETSIGIYVYIMILPLLFLCLIFLSYVASRLSYEPPPHPLVDVFLDEKGVSTAVLWFSLVLACLIGPAIEEVFFRGFLYPALKKYWGKFWAMSAVSALFAGVHENLFSFVPIFLLGFVLCYLYEKRKNVVSCISLHVVHNAAFILYFFVMKNMLFRPGG